MSIGQYLLRWVWNPLAHSPQLFQIFKESVRKDNVRAYRAGQVSWLALFCSLQDGWFCRMSGSQSGANSLCGLTETHVC